MPAVGEGTLVCLDYDGVLVDSLEHLLALAIRAQARLGLGRPPTHDDFRLIDNLTFRDLALRCEVPECELPRYAGLMFELQREDRHVPALFAGIADLLLALSARHHLAIVTASLEANVRAVLRAHRLEHTVSAVLDGSEGGDKAQRIGIARERFAVAAARTWMVGDAVSDIRAGHAAGVRTLAVSWGYQSPARLAAEAPTQLAARPADIERMIDTGPVTASD